MVIEFFHAHVDILTFISMIYAISESLKAVSLYFSAV